MPKKILVVGDIHFRDKRLEDIGHDEFLEIAERIKMGEKP